METTLRVGVTGHRLLADPDTVANDVDRVLRRLGGVETRMVAVSSLAEGADRIVARRVLARPGGGLVVHLPLPVEEYAADFTSAGSLADFADLLAVAAEVHVVAPAPADPAREAAYERAGIAVLDHCDVLLALWDGTASRGRGGTAEIVAEARDRGRRVEVVAVRRGSG